MRTQKHTTTACDDQTWCMREEINGRKCNSSSTIVPNVHTCQVVRTGTRVSRAQPQHTRMITGLQWNEINRKMRLAASLCQAPEVRAKKEIENACAWHGKNTNRSLSSSSRRFGCRFEKSHPNTSRPAVAVVCRGFVLLLYFVLRCSLFYFLLFSFR